MFLFLEKCAFKNPNNSIVLVNNKTEMPCKSLKPSMFLFFSFPLVNPYLVAVVYPYVGWNPLKKWIIWMHKIEAPKIYIY